MDSKVLPTTTKWKPPNAGKGRVKGVPNKMTAGAKEAIQMVFDGLGGVPKMLEWAKKDKNLSIFYASIYPRLIPVSIKGDDNPDSAPIQLVFREAKKGE